MSSRRRLFGVLYRLGFTPWDGHPLSQRLRDLIEGSSDTEALPPGRALDTGCGTGDSSIYLARHGWQVTGVDYVAKPLEKACAKAEACGVSVEFVQAHATALSRTGLGADFTLVVDNGRLHGMSAEDRDAYVREVTAVTAPGARLVIVAFVLGSSFGVPGVEPVEVERCFTPWWQLLATGDETAQDHTARTRRATTCSSGGDPALEFVSASRVFSSSSLRTLAMWPGGGFAVDGRRRRGSGRRRRVLTGRWWSAGSFSASPCLYVVIQRI